MRFAIVVGGRVENVVEAEEDFAAEQGWIACEVAAIDWLWDGETFAAPQAVEVDLSSAKMRMAIEIDDRVAEVYNRWFRFDAEYTAREAAARTFVAAGYAGEPEVWVSAFADSAGKDFRSAADLIIVQADKLRSALLQLGALRMEKYKVLGALGIEAAYAAQRQILMQINAIAEGL